jgi:hypothetical protein
MNINLWKKAFGLALKGRLWLVPIDSHEEVGLSINKERTITMVYPDHELLDSSHNERGVEATILGNYMMYTAANIDKPVNKSHFNKWFKSRYIVEKKGKNK